MHELGKQITQLGICVAKLAVKRHRMYRKKECNDQSRGLGSKCTRRRWSRV